MPQGSFELCIVRQFSIPFATKRHFVTIAVVTQDHIPAAPIGENADITSSDGAVVSVAVRIVD